MITLDATQSPATWGLDRIDQRALPLSQLVHVQRHRRGRHGVHHRHRHPHQPLAVRRPRGHGVRRRRRRQRADDCNGHGTHVAGTVGGSTYGVAKGVTLVAVRVLNCSGSGSNSGVIAGIDWVTGNHAAGTPAVANMSLGGGASSALDTAVRNSIADGVTYAIAAGNSNANACNSSPARTAEAITVGSTTSTDARVVVLELRHVPGHLRAGLEHHVRVVHVRHRHEHDQRHVDGDAARRRRGRAVPPGEPDALAAAGPRPRSSTARTTGVVTSPGTGSPNRLLYSLLERHRRRRRPRRRRRGGGRVHRHAVRHRRRRHPVHGTYYQSTATGTHHGCLSGPAGTRLRPVPAEVERLDVGERRVVARAATPTENDQLQRHRRLLPVARLLVLAAAGATRSTSPVPDPGSRGRGR